jgi:hypothetical protein
MKKRKPRVASTTATRAAAEAESKPENPPDLPIATFIANHNVVARVVGTGPRDRRTKVVHFTFPNGDRHEATMGAVFVLRELCDQVIRNCGTDILVPRQETASAKEPA